MTLSRTAVRVAFLCLLGSSLYAQPGATASISGTLKTQDGKSVTSVVRLRSKSNPYAAPASVTPPAGGAFTFAGLAAGVYEVCANVLDDYYVDPCLWSNAGLPVTVQAGQAVTGLTLTLKKASTLSRFMSTIRASSLRIRAKEPS